MYSAGDRDELQKLNFLTDDGDQKESIFLEIITRVDLTINEGLPRPKETLAQFKDAACDFLQCASAN